MCGIAGVLDVDGSATETLVAIAGSMATTLSHRGPDAMGTWADPSAGVAFGHTRLAIIDLSPAGRQPMVSSCGRYVITFNGEIYNFPALRSELTSAGHQFRGRSDTEVLLAAFTRWGIRDTLPKLNGMFAFGVWDRDRRLLHLARDRFGEKPLYYGWTGDRFLFASELKALRAVDGFRPEIDREAVALLLRYRYIPSPWSIYRGVSKLPPATMLTIDPADRARNLEPETYWSPREAATRSLADPFLGTPADAADLLDVLLRDAVGLRMQADVPVGAFLSGGIDSSAIVSQMQALSADPVRTFTIGLDHSGFDETEQAAAIARHLGTEHINVHLTGRDALEVIPRLPVLYDEPFCDSSQIPTVLVSTVARRHVTVALSGDGGDEIFGGYNRHAWTAGVWRRARRMPLPARRALATGLRRPSPASWDRFFRTAQAALPRRARVRRPGEKIHKLAALLPASGPMDMYRILMSHWNDPSAVVLGAKEPRSVLTDTEPDRLLDATAAMMLTDAENYLPDDILTKVDRASMSVGLEVRVPFLDHRIFELAWRLPADFKIRDGTGKWLLRNVLHRTVPSTLVGGPKTGFGVPLTTWLRGPLRDWADDLLSRPRLVAQALLDPDPICALWQEHRSGERDHPYALWDVLMLQAWLDECPGASTVGSAA